MTKKKRERKEAKLAQKVYNKVELEIEAAMNDLFIYWACILWKWSNRKFFVINPVTLEQQELFLEWERANEFAMKLNLEKQKYNLNK